MDPAVLCQAGGVGVESIQKSLLVLPSVAAFCDLVDGVPQVMGAVKDAAGRYVYVNSGFAERVGRAPTAILGTTVTDHFAPELARSYQEQDDHVLATGAALRHHLELIVRSDGTLGWYVTAKTAVRAADGVIVGVMVMSIDLHSQMNSAHAGLASVIAHIRRDIGHPWRVSELAALAGLSSSQLERLCRRTLGIPPRKVLQRLRLEHAVRLITGTDLTLGSIAAECGFYDQASFTRQFRSVLGLTPGSYRRAR